MSLQRGTALAMFRRAMRVAPAMEPLAAWGRLSVPEQARLREFKQFMTHIHDVREALGNYLLLIEELELTALEGRLVGLAPHRIDATTWESIADPQRLSEQRKRGRDAFWDDARKRYPALERNDLPVWKELLPGPGEPVSAISGADYDWVVAPRKPVVAAVTEAEMDRELGASNAK